MDAHGRMTAQRIWRTLHCGEQIAAQHACSRNNRACRQRWRCDELHLASQSLRQVSVPSRRSGGEQDALAGKAGGQCAQLVYLIGGEACQQRCIEHESGGALRQPTACSGEQSRAAVGTLLAGDGFERDQHTYVVRGGCAGYVAKVRIVGRERWCRGCGSKDDGVHAERLQVVHALGYAAKVAAAIAVGVLKGSGIETVEDRALPPRLHGDA